MVPIINVDNPNFDLIRQTGISPEDLTRIFTGNQQHTWSFVDNGTNDFPLHHYFTKNETVKNALAKFLSIAPENINGQQFATGIDLVNAIENNKYGVGFCKLTDIIDPATGNFFQHISILPIDKNGNGQLDDFENIYGSLNDFSRGVWIGKYPKALVSNLFSVTKIGAKNETKTTFLKWIITDGQNLLDPLGYNELVSSEKQSMLEKLVQPKSYPQTTGNGFSIFGIVFLILFVLTVVGIIITLVFNKYHTKHTPLHRSGDGNDTIINQNSLSFPNGLFFDRTHTWAFMEKDGAVKVGIDDFLQHITGTYTRVKMKTPGEKIKKNEQLLSLIQDGKQLNIYSPVSGTIRYVNESLENEPSLINSSPYSDGWLYMIEPSNWLREIQFLKMAESHKEWLKAEFIKLKDFLVSVMNGKSNGLMPVVLQDGGSLRDHVLEQMGPKVWEDFQKRFLDACGIN